MAIYSPGSILQEDGITRESTLHEVELELNLTLSSLFHLLERWFEGNQVVIRQVCVPLHVLPVGYVGLSLFDLMELRDDKHGLKPKCV